MKGLQTYSVHRLDNKVISSEKANWKLKRKVLLLILLATVISCKAIITPKKYGPLELGEIYTVIPDNIPVYYYINEGSSSISQDFNTIYYYWDFGDALYLHTYLIDKGSQSSNVPLARITTSSFSDGSTIPISGTVVIEWAQEKTGYRCRVDVVEDEIYPSVSYQTCLLWLDQEKWYHKIYSTWSETDTLYIINHLIKFNR